MSDPSVARPVPEDPQAELFPLQASIDEALEDLQAPASSRPCACYDGWVFLGVQTEDGDEIIEAVPCRRCQ